MILHATSVLGAWLFLTSWFVGIFLSFRILMKISWLDFSFVNNINKFRFSFELFRWCCVFIGNGKISTILFDLGIFWRWFYVIFSFPPNTHPPQISLCANSTHPKRKKRKRKKRRNLKKINWVKSKRVWHVLELVEATLLPPYPRFLIWV